jgi:hypothetical protein
MTAVGPVAQLRFVLRLARRFTRSQALARSTMIVFISALFVMAMFITLKTLSLSGAQVADRDVGRFDASVGYGSVVLPPGDDIFGATLRERAIAAGASEAILVLSATDVQLPTTPARDVTMLEADWQSRPYPARYQLLSGRWPNHPGEVIVTEPEDVAAVAGETMPVLGGRVKLQIVGTANDRYANTTNLLVAPGTWDSIDPKLVDGFRSLGAQPFLLWAGEERDAVMAAFTAAAQDWASRTGAASADPDAVTASLMTRQDLLVQPEKTWVERTPAGYTVPSLLLPVGAVLLVFGLNSRRFRITVASLVSLGVRPVNAVAGLTLAAMAWCLAAAALGALAGTAIGVGVRALIAQLRDRPPGPIDALAAPTLRLLALILLTGLCASLVLLHERRGAAHPTTQRGRRRRWISAPVVVRRARDARHLLAVAAWCATAVYASQVDSTAKAMILAGVVTAAVLLVIPDVVGLLLRVLPESGPRRRLTRRQLAADPRRVGAALTALTVLLGASLSFFTLLSTIIKTLDQQAFPDVLPGQVLLADRASITLPPRPEVLQAADTSGTLSGLPRLELGYAFTTDDTTGNVTRSATRSDQIGSLLAVETPAQAEQLIGHRLDPAQSSTLTSGGLLIWADAPDPPKGPAARTRLDIRSGDALLGRTPDLPAASVTVDLADWRGGTDGVLLRSTGQNLGLPLRAGPIMVTGVSDEQAKVLQDAVGRAGMDARSVRIYVPPPSPIPPAAVLVTAVGLALLALAAVLAATRAQARTLRSYLARLVAIGIPPSWAKHVLLYQHGILIVVSSLLGLIIALIPTTILAYRVPGFILSIPWGQLLTLLAVIYLATTLAALHSVITLRARERKLPAM